MFRNLITIGGLFSMTVLAACQPSPEVPAGPQRTPAAPAPPAAPAAPAAAPAPGTRTTMSGIYTAAQATRGQQVFQAVCSECHDTDDWKETQFLTRWQGQPLYQLFHQIHTTMPYGAPGSLSRQQYADIVAYILQINNLPAGSAELGSDDDSLDAFDIDWGTGR